MNNGIRSGKALTLALMAEVLRGSFDYLSDEPQAKRNYRPSKRPPKSKKTLAGRAANKRAKKSRKLNR